MYSMFFVFLLFDLLYLFIYLFYLYPAYLVGLGPLDIFNLKVVTLCDDQTFDQDYFITQKLPCYNILKKEAKSYIQFQYL